VRDLRIFAGYAGWSGGQLELELESGGWYVVDAEDDDVFTDRPDSLWRDVLQRQRSSLRAMAFYPDDPRSN
jgi:putative transcriptional regulator